MSKQAWAYWRGLLSALLVASLLMVVGLAEARMPDLSYWTKNLSESALPTEPALPDRNSEIAVSGNTVHVIWFTASDPLAGSDQLYYRRSTDGGQTWQPKQLVFTHEWSTLRSEATLKRLVVEGDYVHIAVCTSTNLYYLRSADQGASFAEPKILYTAAHRWTLADNYIAVSDGKLTICFQQAFQGDMWDPSRSGGIILNSDDHGVNFSQHVVFDKIAAGINIRDLLRVGNRIYVLSTHTDGYYYNRLYLAASSNAGGTFTENFISVPSKSGEHKTATLQDAHYVPKMAGVGNNVSVIWAGLDADDVLSVFYRQSAVSGVTFSEAQNFSRGVIPADRAIVPGQETLAAQGSYVYSLFLSTAPNAGKVYLRRSVDSGNIFLGLQELTTTASYIYSGWWPVIKTDPSVASGAKVHVLWNYPTYCYSADGGASFTKPELVTPYFSYGAAYRPYMDIGADGRVHLVVEGGYSGGAGDVDIFYRGISPAPAPSGSNNALRLVSNTDNARYDNMQVPASSYLNFSSQMTGEVWVRPYPGGKTTGTTSGLKPIFHKAEAGWNWTYALQTWDHPWAPQRQAQAVIQTTDGQFWVNPASSTAGLVPDGTWSHLAFTYNAAGGGDNFKLYLNGQLIASTTATGNLATGDGLFLTGYYGVWDVAELRLWNRALSQAEIAANRFKTLTGSETGLNAYYTFKNTTKDLTGHGNDGILMYMEQYISENIPSMANPALYILLLE